MTRARQVFARALAAGAAVAIGFAPLGAAADGSYGSTEGSSGSKGAAAQPSGSTATEQQGATGSQGSGAQGPSAPMGEQGMAGSSGKGSTGVSAAGPTLDVEELNDNVARYVGQRVTVSGEIQEWLDARSFILESGGIFDDEIAVVVPRDAKGISPAQLSEDADVVIVGTVRQAALVDVERELGWDLRPELEVEFAGTRSYLVAESVTRK